MDDTQRQLSANLQRSYTMYKNTGKTPLLLPAIEREPSRHVFSRWNMTRSHTMNIPEAVTNQPPVQPVQSPLLPTIPGNYKASDCQLPVISQSLPAPALLQGVARPEPFSDNYEALCGSLPEPDNIEYEVDDAAGIPTINFFKKPYSLPKNRSGRIGGAWRHIRQCTGQGGSNLLFVDGKVKDADIARYPPYGVVSTQFLTNQLGQRMIPKKGGVRATEPNARAKGGFEYWYKEPKQKYISDPRAIPVRTISGHQYKIKGL